MEHISVIWKHRHRDEPARLVSELDGERFEIRKLEFFPDGSVGLASKEGESGSTRLGEATVPPLAESNEDPEFEGVPITNDEFDQLWQEHGGTTAFRR
jgi:hypothetical protein